MVWNETGTEPAVKAEARTRIPFNPVVVNVHAHGLRPVQLASVLLVSPVAVTKLLATVLLPLPDLIAVADDHVVPSDDCSKAKVPAKLVVLISTPICVVPVGTVRVAQLFATEQSVLDALIGVAVV